MSKMEKKNVLYRNDHAERLAWSALETEIRKWLGKKPISAGVKSIFEDVKQNAVTGKYAVELKIGTIGNNLFLRAKKANAGSVGGHLQDVKLATNWTRPPDEEEDQDHLERCRAAIAAREEARAIGEEVLRDITALDDRADKALANLAELLRNAHIRIKTGSEVREAALAPDYLQELVDAKREAGPLERRFFEVFDIHRADTKWNTFGVKAQDIPGYGQGFVTTVLKNLYSQISAKVEEIDNEHAQGVELADQIATLARTGEQARALVTRQLEVVAEAVRLATKSISTMGGAEFPGGPTDVERKLENYLAELKKQDDPQNRLARLDMLLNLYEKATGILPLTTLLGRRMVAASRQLEDLEQQALDKTAKTTVKELRTQIKEVVKGIKAWTEAVADGKRYVTKAKGSLD